MLEWVIFGGVYLFLMLYLLPKLGVPT